MRKVIPFFPVFIFLSFIAPQAQEKARISVLGTRISIDKIEGFDFEDFYPSLVNFKDKCHIFFYEDMKKYEKMVQGFTESNSGQNNQWRPVNDPKQALFGKYSGTLLNLSYEHGLIQQHRMASQIFIHGDSIQSFAVGFWCGDSLLDKYKSLLEKVVQSLTWDTDKELIPTELYDFTIEPKGKFNISAITPVSIIYTPYRVPIDSLVSIPVVYLKMIKTNKTMLTEESEQKMFESQIEYAHPNISISKVLEFQKIIVDGIRGYESVNIGINDYTDSSVVVYSAILFYPLNYIGIIGIANPREKGQYVELYKEMVRSFRRSATDGDSGGVCNKLILQHKLPEALRCYEREIKNNPQLTASWLGKAKVLFLQQKHKEALAIYNKIIDEYPSLSSAYTGRARISFALKQYAEAVRDYDKTIEFNTNDTILLSERAAAKNKFGNVHGAIIDYQKVAKLSHNKASLYCTIGTLQTEVLEYEAALNSFAAALSFNNYLPEVYEERGATYFKMNRFKDALLDYNQTLQLKPGAKDIFIKRSTIKRIFGDLDGALQDCNMFLKSTKKGSPGFAERGMVQFLRGEFASAVGDFNKALSEDPEDYGIMRNRGIAKFFLEKYIAASSDFRSSASGAQARIWLYLAESKGYNGPGAKRNLTMYKNGMKDNQYSIDYLLVRFFLNELSDDQFIKEIKEKRGSTFRNADDVQADFLCDAMFFIGLKSYSSGQKVAAKNQWRRSLETNRPENFTYQVARSFISGAIK